MSTSRPIGTVGTSKNEWATPQPLFDALDAEFHFTLDPCATAENAKCEKYYTKEQDGLKQSWAGETVWLNPPFGGQTEKWMRKAQHASAWLDATVVCLVRAGTDTAWWHDVALLADGIRFIKGKVEYVHADGRCARAAFPSVVLVYHALKLPLYKPRRQVVSSWEVPS